MHKIVEKPQKMQITDELSRTPGRHTYYNYVDFCKSNWYNMMDGVAN